MSATRDVLSRVTLPQVWAALGGGEIRHQRGKAFWRGGDGWNVSLDFGRGLWHDHARGAGGGIIELVTLSLSRDKAGAIKWLAELAGVALAEWTSDERAEYARLAARRRVAEAEARELVAWKDELLREIADWRAVQWRAHHRAQRVIAVEGIATERGAMAADVIGVSEKQVARLDAEYDRINHATWEQLLPEFRATTGRRVTA